MKDFLLNLHPLALVFWAFLFAVSGIVYSPWWFVISVVIAITYVVHFILWAFSDI